jgi:hypothetical protein
MPIERAVKFDLVVNLKSAWLGDTGSKRGKAGWGRRRRESAGLGDTGSKRGKAGWGLRARGDSLEERRGTQVARGLRRSPRAFPKLRICYVSAPEDRHVEEIGEPSLIAACLPATLAKELNDACPDALQQWHSEPFSLASSIPMPGQA